MLVFLIPGGRIFSLFTVLAPSTRSSCTRLLACEAPRTARFLMYGMFNYMRCLIHGIFYTDKTALWAIRRLWGGDSQSDPQWTHNQTHNRTLTIRLTIGLTIGLTIELTIGLTIGLTVILTIGPTIGLTTDSQQTHNCLLYTSPSPRVATLSRMPSSA